MKKSTISVTLSFAMTLLLLGCNSGKSSTPNNTSTPPQSNPPVTVPQDPISPASSAPIATPPVNPTVANPPQAPAITQPISPTGNKQLLLSIKGSAPTNHIKYIVGNDVKQEYDIKTNSAGAFNPVIECSGDKDYKKYFTEVPSITSTKITFNTKSFSDSKTLSYPYNVKCRIKDQGNTFSSATLDLTLINPIDTSVYFRVKELGAISSKGCSGILVRDNLILTAAHCFADPIKNPNLWIPGEISFRSGDKAKAYANPILENNDVETYAVSPEYAADNNALGLNDVAYIKLKTNVDLGNLSNKICIVPQTQLSKYNHTTALKFYGYASGNFYYDNTLVRQQTVDSKVQALLSAFGQSSASSKKFNTRVIAASSNAPAGRNTNDGLSKPIAGNSGGALVSNNHPEHLLGLVMQATAVSAAGGSAFTNAANEYLFAGIAPQITWIEHSSGVKLNICR